MLGIEHQNMKTILNMFPMQLLSPLFCYNDKSYTHYKTLCVAKQEQFFKRSFPYNFSLHIFLC